METKFSGLHPWVAFFWCLRHFWQSTGEIYTRCLRGGAGGMGRDEERPFSFPKQKCVHYSLVLYCTVFRLFLLLQKPLIFIQLGVIPLGLQISPEINASSIGVAERRKIKGGPVQAQQHPTKWRTCKHYSSSQTNLKLRSALFLLLCGNGINYVLYNLGCGGI